MSHATRHYDFSRPTAAYLELARDLESLLADEHDLIANAANTAALIFDSLPDLNWAGFYLYKSGELVLGPFQGKPACVRIAMGKGVCGSAAERLETVRVEDVHAFPGHIACDAASNAEIVVPLVRDGRLLGVLDLDSPRRGRFGIEDQRGIEALARIFVDSLQSPLPREM
jgi:L-methionine (R)-S-oxide reductase